MGSVAKIKELVGANYGHNTGTPRRAPEVLTGQPVGQNLNGFVESLKQAKFPERYLTARLGRFELDTPERKRALKQVTGWMSWNQKGRWLYIFGSVGTGKSHLAHAIMAEFMADGRQAKGECLSVDWMSLCTELKSKANYGMNAEQTLRDISRAKILIIDDFGKSLTPWNLELGFLVLNGRYNRQQITILTSNDTTKSIRAKGSPGDAIADRIQEVGTGINLGNNSRRVGGIKNG